MEENKIFVNTCYSTVIEQIIEIYPGYSHSRRSICPSDNEAWVFHEQDCTCSKTMNTETINSFQRVFLEYDNGGKKRMVKELSTKYYWNTLQVDHSA